MVHRQKLKVDEYACSQADAKPALPQVVELCKLRFFEKYDRWCRIRNTMIVDPPMARTETAQQPFPMMPPVATLEAGERIRFNTAYGAALLHGWSGFNDVEHWGVWTRRHALICFRVTTPDVAALRIELGGLMFLGRQRVSLSVGKEEWQEIELQGEERRLVDLPVAKPGIVWLFIDAHDAVVPPSADKRLLGVGLYGIEAVTAASLVRGEAPPSPDRIAEFALC